MMSREPGQSRRLNGRHGGVSAILVSVSCFLRGLPLFVSTTPKTPLRVLCIIAFDTLHVLRTSKPLPRHRLRVLATLLDLGACANAALDNKGFCPQEYQATRQRLQDARISPSVDEYLRQLWKLERQRPSPGGGRRHFDEVRLYREAVVRLSLGIVATASLGPECTAGGIRGTYCDDALETLFRIVMQCQIIDDVLDYAKDRSAGLPTFLTASASLPRAMEWTAQAARNYAIGRDLAQSGDIVPLRLALFVVSAFAKLVIRIRHWKQRIRWARLAGCPDREAAAASKIPRPQADGRIRRQFPCVPRVRAPSPTRIASDRPPSRNSLPGQRESHTALARRRDRGRFQPKRP